jgi:VanZ family protein
MSSSRGAGLWIRAWLPVAVGIAVIAAESTQYFGADRTSGPLRWLFQSLFGAVGDDRWEKIHHIIRKSGHFVGYGLLALTWLRAWWMSMPRSRFILDSILALAATGLIAGADEFHQTFLPNRTGKAWDVLLDCCGALFLQWLTFLWLRFFRPDTLVNRY